MEINELIKKFIGDILISFKKYIIEDFENEQIFSKDEIMEQNIYYRFWEKDLFVALEGHDFDVFPLSKDMVTNWLLRYIHALCEYNLLDRPTLKMEDGLDSFRPRSSILQELNQRKLLNFEIQQSENPWLMQQLMLGKPSYSFNGNYGDNIKDSELNAESISEHFHFLLEMEDVEILSEFVTLVQYNVNLKTDNFKRPAKSIKDKNFYLVQLNAKEINKIQDVVAIKIDEVVVIQSSEKGELSLLDILIPNDVSDEPFLRGCVYKYLREKLIFTIPQEFQIIQNLKSVDLVFRPTRVSIRYQHQALAFLSQNIETKKYIFPEQPLEDLSTKPELTFELVNPEIAENPEQLQAVCNIVSGTNSCAPYIIFGPPGTGKTTTIVEAILQLRLQNPDSRILVAAGSNAACDTVAARLCEHFKNNELLQKHLENTTQLPMLRVYSKSIFQKDIKNIPYDLYRRSNIEWCNGDHGDPSLEYICRYGIIISTLCTVGKYIRGLIHELKFFTHIFIDEAAASTEPETLIGFVSIKNENPNCQIILSGDHKQLGPVIKSNKAAKLGLDKSLMDRLMETDSYAINENGDYNRTLQMRLRRNYRSHPEIVRLFNHLYYNNELIAMKYNDENNKNHKKWSLLPNQEFPISFVAVQGVTRKDKTTSSCNILEVKVVLTYVHQLLNIDKVEQTDIGIITPYKLQSEYIKSHLKEKNWEKIETGSVENFQGREKTIIIASMVRSNKRLGFVRCPRRLNVLLSRPKSLLIVIGDPVTLSGCEDLKFIIDECKAKGNYLDPNKMILNVDTEQPKKTETKKVESKVIAKNCSNEKENDKSKINKIAKRQATEKNKKSKKSISKHGSKSLKKDQEKNKKKKLDKSVSDKKFKDENVKSTLKKRNSI